MTICFVALAPDFFRLLHDLLPVFVESLEIFELSKCFDFAYEFAAMRTNEPAVSSVRFSSDVGIQLVPMRCFLLPSSDFPDAHRLGR